MANFTDIRTKMLARLNLQVKNNGKVSEEEITCRVMQPYAALAIAWDLLQDVCEPQKGVFRVAQKEKQLYGRISTMFRLQIFSKGGIVYIGFTDDEVALFDEYIDKVTDGIDKDMDMLYYQLQSKLMSVPTDKRNDLCKILTAEILTLLAYDSIHIDLHKKVEEIQRAARSIHSLAVLLINKYSKEDVNFDDKMFETTLTILFKRITKINLNGIQQE